MQVALMPARSRLDDNPTDTLIEGIIVALAIMTTLARLQLRYSASWVVVIMAT